MRKPPAGLAETAEPEPEPEGTGRLHPPADRRLEIPQKEQRTSAPASAGVVPETYFSRQGTQAKPGAQQAVVLEAAEQEHGLCSVESAHHGLVAKDGPEESRSPHRPGGALPVGHAL